jgi:exosortase
VQLSRNAENVERLSHRFSVPKLHRFNLLTFQRSSVLTIAAPLALLWWRLIDQLRLEWSINPQYAYGWAVPFLCLYLCWQCTHQSRQHRASPVPNTRPLIEPPTLTLYVLRFTSCLSRLAQSPLLASGTLLLLGTLWLPIRLVQKANPEWRLVSWALAFEVIGLTLVLARVVLATRQNLRRTSDLLLPVCFILVAVPWPSVIEEPLIRGLSRSTTALTCEALNLAGIPAVQQGNLVEVRSGVVGIEEACSGIRSFQASLMLALLFGSHYRLKTRHRLALVLAGWLLALGSNIARTTLLAGAVAERGMPTVAAWHDPVGLLSSVTCFLVLALLARTVANIGVVASNKAPSHTIQSGLASITVHSRFENGPQFRNRPLPKLRQKPGLFFLPFGVFRIFRANRISAVSGIALLVWLLLADALAEGWYRTHESTLPAPITWNAVAPPEATALDQKPLSPKAKQSLRFDFGRDLTWHDADGRKWQAIFLYWAPGRVAARLANDHTPAICLSASGRVLLAQTKQEIVSVAGLQMQVRFYAATDQRFGKVHVLYCIREDHSVEEYHSASRSIWYQRLAPVLAGRRNCGQRSLELAVWGIADETEARKQLIQQMQRIVCIEHTPNTMSNLIPCVTAHL